MIAPRRFGAVGVAAPDLRAWARRGAKQKNKTKTEGTALLRVRPESNWRPQDLQSYALPLSYTPAVRAGWRLGKKVARAPGRNE